MAEAKFYTYIHRKADSGDIFYVGKGSGRRAHSTKDRNKFWKNIVAKHGRHVEIVAYHSDDKAALLHEKILIKQYREIGARLANMTHGGEGQAGRVITPDHRRKLSEALKGRGWSACQRSAYEASSRNGAALSDAHKAKISVASKGVPSPLKNVGRSDEVKAKISAALKGRMPSKRNLEALALSRIGKPLSDAHKARISAAKKGVSPAPFTDEHRSRMSESRRQYFARRRADSSPI